MAHLLYIYPHSRPALNSSRLAWFVAILAAVAISGCGKYPEPIGSANDITKVDPSTEMLTIPLLPIEAYPSLAKFSNLRRIDFYHPRGVGADDDRLKVLAQLPLTKLKDISLLNCPAVTDAGIVSLTGIKSLIYLQLEGTTITDAALDAIASKSTIVGLNVANCRHVTTRGLLRAIESEKLESFSFSTENLDQIQVLDLISRFRSVKHCEIVDVAGKLDVETIKNSASAKQVKVVLRRAGALQTMESVQ